MPLFARADAIYSIEAMMGNRWALQAGTSRNIPLDQGDAGPGLCIVCGKPANEWIYWARAY